jgi:hypothetical protein
MRTRMAVTALLLFLALPLALAPAASADPNPLKNLKVTGTLDDGGTFTGKLTVVRIGYDITQGLVVSGVLKGKAVMADGSVQQVRETFTAPALLLSGSGDAAQKAVCDILFLDLGPLSLDLLGLTVDLSQIVLDINAVSGSGNLLGNLLCAVTGLLDPLTGFLQILETLGELLDLLDQINELLG